MVAYARKVREAITLALIALCIGMTVYTLLGLAWTFKTAVEAPQKIRKAF